VEGDYTQSADGVLEVEVGGPGAGSQYDQLRVTGTSHLGGALRVVVLDTFIPGPADQFQFVPASAVAGAFASTSISTPPGGGRFDLSFDPSGAAKITFEPKPPTVASVVINDGHRQRSMVRRITITFSEAVTVDAGAFEVRTKGKLMRLHVTTREVAGKTVAVLAFRGRPIQGGSLPDGSYTLTMHAGRIRTSGGLALDGDNDGLVGGNAVAAFFRRFGDANGNGRVDGRDARLFRTTLNKTAADAAFLAYFDFDGDGDVDGADSSQLARRRVKGMARS
jgi:hypothetical protein